MPAATAETPVPDVFADIEQAFSGAKQTAAAEATADEMSKAAAEITPTLPQPDKVPYWIAQCHDDYTSGIAHTFIFHGNITDYPDRGSGSSRASMETFLAAIFDSVFLFNKIKAKNPKAAPLRPELESVFAFYSMSAGLVFPDPESKKLIEKMVTEHYGERLSRGADFINAVMNPGNEIQEVVRAINFIFEASKANVLYNRTSKKTSKLSTEVKFTVAFFNGNYCFPNGPILHMQADRSPVAYVYNWAQDAAVGDRNRVIIMTPSLDDIHETIRGGDSCVSAILIRRPNLDERESWLKKFEPTLQALPEDRRPPIGGKRRTSILFSPEVNHHIMAVQCAGLNLKQQEQIIRTSWRSNEPIDLQMIRVHKQRAVEETYAGLVDFVEPEHGFEIVGGHKNLKDYNWRKIIGPLQRGDKRTCSKGVIWSGPPGTGKTVLAAATARESKMNFLVGNLGRLFGGVVGETESKTRRFLAAVDSAAPVILFLDEIDSVLSSGRQSPGDSGTAARVFNSLMTYLSDDSRAGRVVVIAATNRPDLLDTALIRSGRFDAILPALPPAVGDVIGRSDILKALCRKHKVRFDASMSKTARNEKSGLGRLLLNERIWTGAEIEVVLKEAIDNFLFRREQETLVEILQARGGFEQKQINDLIENPYLSAIQHLKEKEIEAFHEKISDNGHNPVIGLDDWNGAMDAVQPNTRDMDLQIKLALKYVNNYKYCPADWLELAKNKDDLEKSIATYTMSDGGYN